MKIAWVTPELTPFVKVGGLADVSSALPKAIKNLGHDIRIIMPYFDFIELDSVENTGIKFEDYKKNQIHIYKTVIPDSSVTVYLVKHPVFNSKSVYGEKSDDNPNLEYRFSLLSWVGIEIYDQIDWIPNIIHTHDWPTGPAMSFLRKRRDDGKHLLMKSIFTIHNLAYKGTLPTEELSTAGLESKYLRRFINKKERTVDFIRLGINHADKVTTVSENYAKEILTAEYGYGLEDDLQQHENDISGVVHGIDLDAWNPSKDKMIPKNYSTDSIDNKFDNKIKLQKEAGLKQDRTKFSIGIVSRLVYQKGIDLLIETIPEIIQKDLQFYILGTGQEEYETQLIQIKEQFESDIGLFITYNERLSHLMFAGLDALVIPSRYEPCGLTQLYAMKYGTIPIVRKTGGLADTVNESSNNQNGFLFTNFDKSEFKNAIYRAFNMFKNAPEDWKKIQIRGMMQDLSWDKPAKKWIDIYNSLL